jgi:hypothetical protein
VSNFRIPTVAGRSVPFVLHRAMVRCALSFLSCLVLSATVHVRQSGFQPAENGLPAGWKVWAARGETAPRTFVDTAHYRSGPGSLAISGDSNSLVYGGWHYAIPSVEGGKWYRFAAYYRTESVPNEQLQVIARLWWTRADGKRSGAPDYPYTVTREGEWTRLSIDAQAPDKTADVTIHLYLANAPQGTLWWDDVSLDEIPAPPPRRVTIATIHLQPKDSESPEESVFFCRRPSLSSGRLRKRLMSPSRSRDQPLRALSSWRGSGTPTWPRAFTKKTGTVFTTQRS